MAKNSFTFAIRALNNTCADALADIAASADECLDTFKNQPQLVRNQNLRNAVADLDATVNDVLDQLETAMHKYAELQGILYREIYGQGADR